MAQYGRTTVGAAFFSIESRVSMRRITVAAGQTATKISAYLRSAGTATNGLRAALYNYADGTLAYQSDVHAGFDDATGGWKDFTFAGAVAEGDYWLSVSGDTIPGGGNTVEIAHDLVTADGTTYFWKIYSGTWPTLPADIDSESDGFFELGEHNISIYLETTGGGGSSDVPVTSVYPLD